MEPRIIEVLGTEDQPGWLTVEDILVPIDPAAVDPAEYP